MCGGRGGHALATSGCGPPSILYASLQGGAGQINEQTILMLGDICHPCCCMKEVFEKSMVTFWCLTKGTILVFYCLTKGIIFR